MSEDTFTYQYSFKLNGLGGGQGYSMVNVRAADAAAFEAALDAMSDDENGAPGLLSRLLEIDRLVAATGVVAGTPASAAPVQQAAPAQAAAAPGQPAGPPPLGPDGQALQYRTGEKNGRTWRAFMSPHPKGHPNWVAPQWIK